MKVARRRGRLRLQLDPVEVALLESMLDELVAVAAVEDEQDGQDDAVAQRLYPAARPDDAAADAEFRALTHASLRTERLERIGTCVAELRRSRDVDLGDPDVADRWIKVLNDLRLALGTRLGVTEEEPEVDPNDQPRLVYHWLTAVQDTVVTALMD